MHEKLDPLGLKICLLKTEQFRYDTALQISDSNLFHLIRSLDFHSVFINLKLLTRNNIKERKIKSEISASAEAAIEAVEQNNEAQQNVKFALISINAAQKKYQNSLKPSMKLLMEKYNNLKKKQQSSKNKSKRGMKQTRKRNRLRKNREQAERKENQLAHLKSRKGAPNLMDLMTSS